MTAQPGESSGRLPGVDQVLAVATSADMRALGRRLAGLLQAGDLVVLSGPLGAGKTTLTQGIGAGLGVRGSVTSPTFVIARLHPSVSHGPDLVHADAYRLGSRAEVDDLDLDADLATSVTVVEWGEGMVEELADSFLSVGIRADEAGPGGGDGAWPGAATAAEAAAGPGGGDGAWPGAAADTGLAAAAEVAADADIRRRVRVRGYGPRWQGDAVAAQVRQALAVTS